MKSPSFQFPSTASMLAILASTAAFFALLSSPLLGTPGPESALLIGAILAPLAFVAGTSCGAKRHERGFGTDLIHEGTWILFAFLIFGVATWLNSFRFESCSADRGVFSFLILTLPVLLLNLVSGLWLGRLIGNARLAVTASILLLVIYLSAQVMWWWTYPSLRFFNHYWVIIAGDLIEGQGLNPGIIGYRIATMLFALALLILGLVVFKSVHRRRSVAASNSQMGMLLSTFLLFCAGLIAHSISSGAIAPSRASMNAQYSLHKTRGILVLHADPEHISKNDADAILAEGTLWLTRLKARCGISPKGEIHIWLHQDTPTQARYTGAQNVHFTLPNHREIHISGTEIPHSTLGHELAHVLIGQISDTLFGVPGVLGLIPNQGLSEGLAVALTSELNIRDGLTLKEQAAALYELKLEQDFESLFAIDLWSFWSRSPARAYTAAGAFLEALIDARAKTPKDRHNFIRKLVGAGELYPIWSDDDERANFVKGFYTSLLALSLPEDALPSVSRRFDAPAIVFAECSGPEHKTEQAVKALAMQGDYKGAQKRARASRHTASLLGDAGAIAWLQGDDKDALSLTRRALQAPGIKDARQKAELLEREADLLWLEGNLESALQKYGEVDSTSLTIPAQRQLLAKKAFTHSTLLNNDGAPYSAAAWHLLANDLDSDKRIAALQANLGFALGASRGQTLVDDQARALASYIFARHQILGRNPDEGLGQLMPTQKIEALPPLFMQEAQRLMAVAYAMKLEMAPALEQLIDLKSKALRPADQVTLTDLIERAQKMQVSLAPGAGADLLGDKWLMGKALIYHRSGSKSQSIY